MKLFKFEGYKIVIDEVAYALKPFRKLWDRDKTKTKNKAISELGFIYFMCDPRSDYQYITDEDERLKVIKEDEGFDSKWKPDKLLLEAMEFYSSFKPTSALLLEDTRIAVDKLRKLLKDIDLTRVDDKGKPIYTLNTITATIKQIPQLVEDLDKAEKTITSDIAQQGKMRGSGEKTILEDSLDM